MPIFVSFAQQNKTMHLIADGGSTKTEWILIDRQRVAMRFLTQGFNPNYTDWETITAIINNEFPADFPENVEKISYYGSGCGNEKNCQLVAAALRQRFTTAEIKVTHDLMAAAHAVLGHEKGIACILGTGANSCLYDGKSIVNQAVSLGYLVGDEGSGTYIGKKVVRSYFYDLMPDDLRQQFEAEYHLSHKDFIDRLYHYPQPNTYLSSFCKFAGEHRQNVYIQQLASDCFNEFLNVFVCRYEDFENLNVSFVGSVAYHFQDILKVCLENKDLHLGEIIQTPADGLVKYHLNSK